jgi:hypothetical protein
MVLKVAGVIIPSLPLPCHGLEISISIAKMTHVNSLPSVSRTHHINKRERPEPLQSFARKSPQITRAPATSLHCVYTTFNVINSIYLAQH